MMIATDGFAHLMAHSVTASAGAVDSSQGRILVAQVVFHYGWTDPPEGADLTEAGGPVHDTRFVEPSCLRRLISELSLIADQLGV